MDQSSFLVLSDIHFGKLAASPDFASPLEAPQHQIVNATPMKASLIAQVKEFQISAILVSGDLTSVASPKEFVGATSVVEEIANAAGVDSRNIFYTFGNHDTNWRISELSNSTLDFKEDEGYLKVASHLASFFVPIRDCSVPGPVPGSGLYERTLFDVLVLNTGIDCTHSQRYPHGRLGTQQFEWLRSVLERNRDSSKWFLLMLHHHLFNYPYPVVGEDISTLEEGADVLQLLAQSGIHFVCHGHRHHPTLSTRLENGWNKPITFLCAGSVAVNETHRCKGQIPNAFHVITLKSESPEGAAIGHVDTFEYCIKRGWTPSTRTPVFPLDGRQHFGSCSNQAERETAARNWLEALIADRKSGDPIVVNDVDAIPFKLQCVSRQECNEIILTTASKLGFALIGELPKRICLVPLS